jgi:hypothetical protein
MYQVHFRAHPMHLLAFKLLIICEGSLRHRPTIHLIELLLWSHHAQPSLFILSSILCVVDHHLYDSHFVFVFSHLSAHLLSKIVLLQLPSNVL